MEGPAALFKGVGLFSCKRALDWTTRYLFVVFVENAMRGGGSRKLGVWEEAGASLLGAPGWAAAEAMGAVEAVGAAAAARAARAADT